MKMNLSRKKQVHNIRQYNGFKIYEAFCTERCPYNQSMSTNQIFHLPHEQGIGEIVRWFDHDILPWPHTKITFSQIPVVSYIHIKSEKGKIEEKISRTTIPNIY